MSLSRDAVVCDASAIFELLLGTEFAAAVASRMSGRRVIVPAHLDVMVLAAFGRLQRTGSISARSVALRLDRLERAPLERHAIGPLLGGAWRRRGRLRLEDALYVELAERFDIAVVTSDAAFARASQRVEYVGW